MVINEFSQDADLERDATRATQPNSAGRGRPGLSGEPPEQARRITALPWTWTDREDSRTARPGPTRSQGRIQRGAVGAGSPSPMETGAPAPKACQFSSPFGKHLSPG